LSRGAFQLAASSRHWSLPPLIPPARKKSNSSTPPAADRVSGIIDFRSVRALNSERGVDERGEWRMRRVAIVEQQSGAYQWIAIDQATRQSLLRLSDLYQLRDICERLEWKVVDVKSVRGKPSNWASIPEMRSTLRKN
jgi:hypothetical protein